MLVASIFSVSYNVFKRLLSQRGLESGLWGKELKHSNKLKIFNSQTSKASFHWVVKTQDYVVKGSKSRLGKEDNAGKK